MQALFLRWLQGRAKVFFYQRQADARRTLGTTVHRAGRQPAEEGRTRVFAEQDVTRMLLDEN